MKSEILNTIKVRLEDRRDYLERVCPSYPSPIERSYLSGEARGLHEAIMTINEYLALEGDTDLHVHYCADPNCLRIRENRP